MGSEEIPKIDKEREDKIRRFNELKAKKAAAEAAKTEKVAETTQQEPPVAEPEAPTPTALTPEILAPQEPKTPTETTQKPEPEAGKPPENKTLDQYETRDLPNGVTEYYKNGVLESRKVRGEGTTYFRPDGTMMRIHPTHGDRRIVSYHEDGKNIEKILYKDERREFFDKSSNMLEEVSPKGERRKYRQGPGKSLYQLVSLEGANTFYDESGRVTKKTDPFGKDLPINEPPAPQVKTPPTPVAETPRPSEEKKTGKGDTVIDHKGRKTIDFDPQALNPEVLPPETPKREPGVSKPVEKKKDEIRNTHDGTEEYRNGVLYSKKVNGIGTTYFREDGSKDEVYPEGGDKKCIYFDGDGETIFSILYRDGTKEFLYRDGTVAGEDLPDERQTSISYWQVAGSKIPSRKTFKKDGSYIDYNPFGDETGYYDKDGNEIEPVVETPHSPTVDEMKRKKTLEELRAEPETQKNRCARCGRRLKQEYLNSGYCICGKSINDESERPVNPPETPTPEDTTDDEETEPQDPTTAQNRPTRPTPRQPRPQQQRTPTQQTTPTPQPPTTPPTRPVVAQPGIQQPRPPQNPGTPAQPPSVSLWDRFKHYMSLKEVNWDEHNAMQAAIQAQKQNSFSNSEGFKKKRPLITGVLTVGLMGIVDWWTGDPVGHTYKFLTKKDKVVNVENVQKKGVGNKETKKFVAIKPKPSPTDDPEKQKQIEEARRILNEKFPIIAQVRKLNLEKKLNLQEINENEFYGFYVDDEILKIYPDETYTIFTPDGEKVEESGVVTIEKGEIKLNPKNPVIGTELKEEKLEKEMVEKIRKIYGKENKK